jgi:HEAT repeat protein
MGWFRIPLSRPALGLAYSGTAALLRAACIAFVLCVAFVFNATDSPAGVPKLYSIMDHEPVLPTQPIERYLPPEWKQLWRTALAGPEEDLRREAAEAIRREHEKHCPDLDAMSDSLYQALLSSKHPAVRLTIVRALIELDSKQFAKDLFDQSINGGTMESMVIEPALAQWDYKPARDVWLKRLAHPGGSPLRRLMLAIEGVRVVKEAKATQLLRELVLHRHNSPAIRLAAAQALAELQSEGLTGDAEKLSADRSPRSTVDRLAAARLVSTHQGDAPQALMLKLAVDNQPAVAAIALRRLLQIDQELVKPLVPRLLKSRDATVRKLAARSLVERPAIEVFETLGHLLDDIHPDVREYVRDSLFELAKRPEFDKVIRSKATKVLATDSWRGLEQAGRLLGELDHKPAAPRLLELLYFDRSEVHVTAAWSLSQLAIEETLPDMLKFARSVTDKYPVQPRSDETVERLTNGHDACLSHLFLAFGMMKYSDPEPVLVKFIPRRYDLGPRSRGAAIWALGYLHENDPHPDLLKMFAQRAADAGVIPVPEPIEVRTNSAISIGRMNGQAALRALRHVYAENEPGNRIREACGWAIEKITGEDLPDPPIKRETPPTVFLRPVGP